MEPETIEIVRKSSLFQDIRADQLATVIASGVRRSIEEDGYFFMQGDAATHAYVLVQGRVKMLQVTPNGQQITLRMITPGQTYGAVALLGPDEGYPASAQADEDSIALAWDTKSLRGIVSKDPTVSLNVMKLMHGYITELQDRESALTSEKAEQRIARTLLKLAAQTGKKVEGGILIDMPLSRQDVAEMTGTTLFTVSRTLKIWERQGFLSAGRERVLLHDPHSLVRIADDLVK